MEGAEPLPRRLVTVPPKLTTALPPITKRAQHPKNTQKGFFDKLNRPARQHIRTGRFRLAKKKFFNRMTEWLHASLRSTLATIKVFFPPYMPPEKM